MMCGDCYFEKWCSGTIGTRIDPMVDAGGGHGK